MKTQKQLKQRRENFITLGFFIELSLFVLAGYLLAYKDIFSLGIFILAVLVAFKVGTLIAINAVENFKYNLHA